MKLLVTGPTGQLGRDVLRAAAHAPGLSTVALPRSRLDLAEPQNIATALDDQSFDVLINCAAYTAVDGAENEPQTAFAINAYSVEALARVCEARGARLVHVSTDYVFDGESDAPYGEEDAAGPLNVYGSSKLAGEALARRACPSGCTIVRTSSLFGVGGLRDGGGNFVETMIRLGREREVLRVVDDVRMAPTYSRDLAGAILGLVLAEAPADMYHWTNGGEASWHAFAVAIMEGAGISVQVDAIPSSGYPAPARRPRHSVLDTGRAESIVGPAPHWRDALRRYLAERREFTGASQAERRS